MEDEASTSLDGKVIGNLRVVDLKQELEKRGLSKSGSKKDLVKRLKQQLEFEKLCQERKSGDFDPKLELDAETQQNEFVQQYLAQQQRRYAERKEEEKRLELEAIRRHKEEGSDIESQDDANQNAVSDSDETSGEKLCLNKKPSEIKPLNESGDNTNVPALEPPGGKDESHFNTSKTETGEQKDFDDISQNETERDQQTIQNSVNITDVKCPKLSRSTCRSKSLDDSPKNTKHISVTCGDADMADKNEQKEENESEVCINLSDPPSEVCCSENNTNVSLIPKKEEEISSSTLLSSTIIKRTEYVKPQSNASSFTVDVESKISSTSSERASSSEHIQNQGSSENMETSECSSVPYSLSDIQLPESPGHHKLKDAKNEEKGKADSISKETTDQKTSSDNKTKSNGETADANLDSSIEEPVSKSETKESNYNNSPDKVSERKDSKKNRHSDESSDVESDRNSSPYKKKSFKYEDTSSNVAVDSDEDRTKDSSGKEQKSLKSHQQSEESDNEKSSDSEKYNRRHSDSKRKTHGKRRKHNRRSRSSSSSSSHSSDSSPKRRRSKKSLIVSKNKNFTEKDERNHMSDKSSDEKSNKLKKGDSVTESSVPNASPKKRIKIKRDNVAVKITSPTVDSVEKTASSKSADASPKRRLKFKRDNVAVKRASPSVESAEKTVSSKSAEKSSSSDSHSASSKDAKKESSEAKEIIPQVTYTSRKVTLSNRKLNRKASEDKSIESKSKKSKWESFAAGQKTSPTISISTDSLKNWFPDFKLISEASSSMELDQDEHSLSAVDEKTNELAHADVSNENDISTRRESTSQNDMEDSESQEPNCEEISDQGPASKIIFIQNLVRPFTLNQLKDLLKQNGKIVEEFFWIDKIKSKCFVMYETEKEAIKARNALNNTRWPSSNPKILSVEFSNEDELEQHKKGNEPPPPKPLEPPVIQPPETIETRLTHSMDEHKRKDRDRRKERERSKPQAPVREWDKDKIMQDSPEREHIPKEEKSRSSDKKEKKESKKRPNEDTPAKLLDDLFQKTKNPPCIYWLPLTEEQAKQKEDAQKMRKLEREKRNQQLREQEEANRRNKRARSGRRSREKENRKSSTRSRSPVSRRR